jgi:effector-binding domain-containing protein
MFKIGEFSKLSRVPIKTLRYYHQIGLLEPDVIDEFTGYRFYTAVNLIRLNRILALKDLGFSLEQIAQILDDDLSSEQVRGMLRLKEAEIEREIAAEQARLTRIQTRLQQFKQEAAVPHYDVVLKNIEAIQVASVRDVMGHYGEIGQLLDELYGVLAQKGIRQLGPPLAIYHDEGFQETDVDVETAVPIANAQIEGGNGRVRLRQLPAAKVASVLHQGPYTSLSAAYQAIMQWINDNTYQIIGPDREIYLRGPGPNTNPAEYVTEIQFPIRER